MVATQQTQMAKGGVVANKSGSVEDVVRGSANVPLSQEGGQEASNLGQLFAKKGFGKLRSDRIISGKLTRTQQTAQMIAQHAPKARVMPPTEALDTWSTGFEGVPSEQADKRLEQYIRNPEAVPPKINENMGDPPESFNTFKERYIKGALQPGLLYYSQHPSQRVIGVTHGRGVRLARAWVKAGAKPDLSIDTEEMLRDDDKPAEVYRLALGYKGKLQITPVDMGKPGDLKPGYYLVRHASTPWNHPDAAKALMGKSTGTKVDSSKAARITPISPATQSAGSPRPLQTLTGNAGTVESRSESLRAVPVAGKSTNPGPAPAPRVPVKVAAVPQARAATPTSVLRPLRGPTGPQGNSMPLRIQHFQLGGIVNDDGGPDNYGDPESAQGYDEELEGRPIRRNPLDRYRALALDDPSSDYLAYAGGPTADFGSTPAPRVTTPGPWQRRESQLAGVVSGYDASGNPIIDPNTGQPITPAVNAHPSWWRTALGTVAQIAMRRNPAAGQAIAEAIESRDPNVKRARQAQYDYQIAHQQGTQERLNQAQQRMEEMAGARNQAYINYHKQRQDIDAQRADEAALNDITNKMGRPVSTLPPLAPPPSSGTPSTVTSGNVPPLAALPPLAGPGQPQIPQPPTVTGGQTPIPEAVRSLMTMTPPLSSIEGWQKRTVAGQQYQVPPADEAARMKQEATAVPVNVPEAYRRANNIPDSLPLGAARQVEQDYIRQTEGAANREAANQRAQEHNELMAALNAGRSGDREAARTDREARAADIVEKQKQDSLNAASNWEQQQINQLARTGQFGTGYDDQVAAIHEQARQRKQAAMDGYSQAVRRRGGTAPDFTVNEDGSIEEVQPSAARTPAATPRPSAPGATRQFPESRINDLVQRAKANGITLTADQARKQLTAEGWVIVKGK